MTRALERRRSTALTIVKIHTGTAAGIEHPPPVGPVETKDASAVAGARWDASLPDDHAVVRIFHLPVRVVAVGCTRANVDGVVGGIGTDSLSLAGRRAPETDGTIARSCLGSDGLSCRVGGRGAGHASGRHHQWGRAGKSQHPSEDGRVQLHPCLLSARCLSTAEA